MPLSTSWLGHKKELRYGHLRASTSKTNGTIWLNFEIIQDFMPVLVISKFNEISIERIVALPKTKSNMGYLNTQGQITPRQNVKYG